MLGPTIFEFDALTTGTTSGALGDGLHPVPPNVFAWLEAQCLRASESGGKRWLKLTQRRGKRAVQVTSFVGVIRSPDGFQIEVLPKVGKAIGGGENEARKLLIEMLRCLHGFRHVQTDSAKLCAAHMPLLEIFITEFLRSIEHVVKRGLRSMYSPKEGNLFALRGKLLVSPHIRHNLIRADRFFTEHDEYSTNRPENRVIRRALREVLSITRSQSNQKLARELEFAFADVPQSEDPRQDFQRIRLDRGMNYYDEALDWARLILEQSSPTSGNGGHLAPSPLFPMEAVFEAFVAKHLPKQLLRPLTLKTQAKTHHLVRHTEQSWFRMKPDLLVRQDHHDQIVLDTKWKLLDARKANGTDKYGLSQADFYQLQAYGQSYLDGTGDVVLIHPKTSDFDSPLPVFEFPKTPGLRLWVLPFCLKARRLEIPPETPISLAFQ